MNDNKGWKFLVTLETPGGRLDYESKLFVAPAQKARRKLARARDELARALDAKPVREELIPVE
jgi:hypothetical protein